MIKLTTEQFIDSLIEAMDECGIGDKTIDSVLEVLSDKIDRLVAEEV